jgi:hypothetical protein
MIKLSWPPQSRHSCPSPNPLSQNSGHPQIPWNDLSRFDDAEMKALMVDVVNKTYHLIQELFDEEHGGELLLKLIARDPVLHWDDPK